MKKPRDIKVLLQIVIDNFDEYFESGICVLIAKLDDQDIITGDERFIIHNYIHNYKPDTHNVRNGNTYWWKVDSIAPRKRYLNKLLKQLNDE